MKYRYLPHLEISTAYEKQNPNNCAVRERNADGESVGACCFYLRHGTMCPRHGTVRMEKS